MDWARLGRARMFRLAMMLGSNDPVKMQVQTSLFQMQ
jgi:hypothetical protein